jgi:soluble lytic murein transglycosylase
VDLEQRFPMPFKTEVIARAGQIGLDPAYVYGLIRQESRFIMDAKSVVGAAGLMQVMPATAKWTAKKLGMYGFQPQHITDRDTNIAIGTGYLKLVLDSFEGSHSDGCSGLQRRPRPAARLARPKRCSGAGSGHLGRECALQ